MSDVVLQQLFDLKDRLLMLEGRVESLDRGTAMRLKPLEDDLAQRESDKEQATNREQAALRARLAEAEKGLELLTEARGAGTAEPAKSAEPSAAPSSGKA